MRAVFQLCCPASIIAYAKHSTIEVYILFGWTTNTVSADGLKHPKRICWHNRQIHHYTQTHKYQNCNTRHTSFSTVSSNKPETRKFLLFCQESIQQICEVVFGLGCQHERIFL